MRYFKIFFLLFFISNLSGKTLYKFDNIHIFAEESQKKLAETISFQLNNNISNFQKSIGAYDDNLVQIIIAKDGAEYHSWTQKSSTIIEFSSAFYNNKNRTIFLKNPSNLRSLNTINRVLLHEYIHHFINLHIKNPPLWFNEGMAVYFSGDLGINREFNFIKNYLLGNSRELEMMIYGYPQNRVEWESFYAKSALAIKYLASKRSQSFFNFWNYVFESGNFNSAFIKSFSFTPKDFSALFEEYARSHFHAEIFMASSGIIWGLMPLILIIGVIRKKIKTRKIATKWGIEEEIIAVENNDVSK